MLRVKLVRRLQSCPEGAFLNDEDLVAEEEVEEEAEEEEDEEDASLLGVFNERTTNAERSGDTLTLRVLRGSCLTNSVRLRPTLPAPPPPPPARGVVDRSSNDARRNCPLPPAADRESAVEP
jgi:hypothetical protein